MVLTPLMKFVVIAFSLVMTICSEIWLDETFSNAIKEAGAGAPFIDMVSVVLGKLDLAAAGLLAYLGIRAPTLSKEHPVEP